MIDRSPVSIVSSMIWTLPSAMATWTQPGCLLVAVQIPVAIAVEQGDLDLVLLNWGADWPPEISGWVNDQPTDGKVDDVSTI